MVIFQDNVILIILVMPYPPQVFTQKLELLVEQHVKPNVRLNLNVLISLMVKLVPLLEIAGSKPRVEPLVPWPVSYLVPKAVETLEIKISEKKQPVETKLFSSVPSNNFPRCISYHAKRGAYAYKFICCELGGVHVCSYSKLLQRRIIPGLATVETKAIMRQSKVDLRREESFFIPEPDSSVSLYV